MVAIDWFTPRMTGGELDRIKAVLESGYVNDGPVTKEFERQIAQLTGRRYAVAVTSGTAALALAVMAQGAGLGDEIIVPAFTYIATANAVRLTGAQVVLADIDAATFCITAEEIERVITPRTKGVIAVEINGRAPDYDAIMRTCKTFGLWLITDSCEALGSSVGDQPLGSFGSMSCLSFSPNKLVTTGQGGMVVTDTASLWQRLFELKQQGMVVRGTGGKDRHSTYGYNFKFTDVQAAMGLAQLDALNARRQRCRERDAWYRAGLDGTDIEFPRNDDGVHLWTDVLTVNAYAVAARLRRSVIGVREFWHPLHIQIPYKFKRYFAAAETVARMGLWLPSSYDITEQTVAAVCDCIKEELHGVG